MCIGHSTNDTRKRSWNRRIRLAYEAAAPKFLMLVENESHGHIVLIVCMTANLEPTCAEQR